MKKIVIALALISLAGCQSTNTLNSHEKTVYGTDASPLFIIAKESQKAQQATQLLTKYKETHNQNLKIKYHDFDNEKILIDYIGKPDDILQSIAIKYGYRYLPTCQNISLPTVNFYNYYTTPSHGLALIDAQLGEMASVHLDKNQKIITLQCK